MRTVIKNRTMDEERALYHLQSADVEHCNFSGPSDGESALKECRDISVTDCNFSLRYPLWHAIDFSLLGCQMDENTRAALWYGKNGSIINSNLDGIKALRECEGITVLNTKIASDEFGWRCREIKITDCEIESVYCLFESRNIEIEKMRMQGKYSFQYVENMHIKDSILDTKDAFWHSKNAIVENCVVKGEYLGWYSENLTLKNCLVIGTQPLCYCKNLKLIDCTMEKTDLAFEYSEVEATVDGSIDSVKNPIAGFITADSIGSIILEDSVFDTNCKITCRN